MNLLTSLLIAGLSNTILAGVLAVVAVVASRFAKRPQFAHMLWLLVLVKLVTPPLGFQFSALYSLSRVLAPASVTSTILRKSGSDSRLRFETQRTGSRVQRQLSAESIELESEFSVLSVKQFLLIVWTLGTTVVFGVMLRDTYRIRMLVGESKGACTEIQTRAHQIAKALRLSSCPSVMLTRRQVPPFVFGFLGRPKIVLPIVLFNSLSPTQQVTVLTHEIVHVLRRDYLVRWLEALVRLLHWWNPLYWFAANEIRKVEERCCDAWVIWALPSNRLDYGRAIYAAVEFLTCESQYTSVIRTELGQSQVRRRIEMVLKGNPNRLAGKSRLAAVFTLALAVLPLGWAEGQVDKKRDTAWNSFLENPQSEEAFKKAFPVACERADEVYGDWYLSGFYVGDGEDGQEFYVVQAYDGDEKVSFRLGFLLVADSRGQELGLIDRERVYNQIAFEQKLPVMTNRRLTSGRLPDLTGDGISEITTERWRTPDDPKAHSRSYAIYRNRSGILQKSLAVKFGQSQDDNDVFWDGWTLSWLDGPQSGFAINGRLYEAVDEARGRELAEKLQIHFPAMADSGFSQVPSIKVESTLDRTQTPIVFATFNWEEEIQSFLGPRRGPAGMWEVVDSPVAAAEPPSDK